nr:SDR family oxidoreductase [Labrys monachus]
MHQDFRPTFSRKMNYAKQQDSNRHRRQALGRAGLPDDVGPVIAALLSDDFGWVNAQRIEVAGGIHI